MKNNRIDYISLASVLSAIAVVLLHVNESVKFFAPNMDWFSVNIIHSIFFPAVPIFFIISGAMLLNFKEKYDLKTYFHKRISKTVIPYIVWSFFGLFFQIFFLKTISINQINLSYLFFGLINGSFVGVYWFFSLLFLFYILIPVVSHIATDKKHCLYAIVCLFVITLLVSPDGYSKIAIICYVFYGFVGYYIHTWGISQKYKYIWYLLAICGLIMQIIGTFYLSNLSGEINYYFKNYTHIVCIFYSIGLFVFIKYDLVNIMKCEIIDKMISFLDFYTFGIYLIHWYVLKALIKIFNIHITSIYWKLFAPFLIISISVILIYLIRKIPIVKKIVP